MKKRIKIFLILIIIFTVKTYGLAQIKITYAQNVKVDINNFEQQLLTKIESKKDQFIELFIYHYSSGKEIYSIQKDMSIKMTSGPKEIKLAVKIFKKNKLYKIQFLNEKSVLAKDLIKTIAEKSNQFIKVN